MLCRSQTRVTAFAAILLIQAIIPALAMPADPPPEKIPVLIDTDIGSEIDDAFALALALASPELEVRGITTVGSNAEDRAWMVCRFLTAVGHKDIPVAWGRDPQPENPIEGQIQYRRHPAVIFNRMAKPVKESAVELLYEKLKADQGSVTLVALGPLTNIARLLKEHPDCKPWIKSIVLMGGSMTIGYDGEKPRAQEWNIKSDIDAARAVLSLGSDIHIVVVPVDAAVKVKLEESHRQKLFAACTPLTLQLQALYQLWDKTTPTFYVPVALAMVINNKFCERLPLVLEVDDKGFTFDANKKEPLVSIVKPVKAEEFLKWYIERVGAGEPALPKAPGNESALIPRGGMPNRVHCFVDYETDIEKRWWMSGKKETADVPPGSRHACRGVLTLDFDDLQGDMKTMYNAVIFNPVPGPPMGKNPRLSFRYKLHGTDTLRVQIYSLTKGYHRYLSLTKLPQDRWESGTVDMTAVRRPDGTGGPLSEDERIDDVQFYVDPRADLLIDDMVLYDAAVPDEKRPFPKNLHFTGWFDTGKQGKEWPGTFEIVEKAGNFWKAAKSVDNTELQAPWIRLHLRGERPLGETTQLAFRYRLTGADSMRLLLVNRTLKDTHIVELKKLKTDAWAEATVDFSTDSHRGDKSDGKPRKGDLVDEIHFVLPKGAELLLDDVLLFEPGK